MPAPLFLRSVVSYPIDFLASLSYRLYRRSLALESRRVLTQLGKVGSNVSIDAGCMFQPARNVEIGNDVYIGPECWFMTTEARIRIGSGVMFGPQVAIITGNHNLNTPGVRMFDIHEKAPADDQDVTIEDDVWIGFRATILKGVTIGTGAVVAAGAVVTRDVSPYHVVGGVPARTLYRRFNTEPDETRG